jgi:hypothetical protein
VEYKADSSGIGENDHLDVGGELHLRHQKEEYGLKVLFHPYCHTSFLQIYKKQ